MNVVVNKLKLPCDIKMEINKYCYDQLGYNYLQRECINKLKQNSRNKFMKLTPDGVYGKKDPKKVYGGGTLAESQYFRFYNGITSNCKRINDPENDYIEKLIGKGDDRRRQT